MPSTTSALLPIMATVLAGFLTIGLALPVLPLQVHQVLGFGAFAVGLVTGCQFGAAVLTRVSAGHYADTKGAKRGVMLGLATASASGLLYLLSVAIGTDPAASLTVLLCGRALLGAAESLIITGGVSWGLAVAESDRAGKVIAWVGTAMFAALALGAPVGTALYGAAGFSAIGLATVLLPLATALLIFRVPGVAPVPTANRPSLRSVADAVWLPGVGAAFASLGYGVILTFGSLLYAQLHWQPVWLSFCAFAAALILARLTLGDLPDRLGGARIALLFAIVEGAGLALIAWTTGPLVAALGAAMTGFGYSLVYPGLGKEAVRSLPPESRGVAMGMYTIFLDLALGLGSPLLGLVAGWSGVAGAFAAGALLQVGTLIAARLLLAGRSDGQTRPKAAG
ncbi:arabinose transporter [Solirhodobacter olei]|uniref:arabinose transporter n=1 Tax=Solirhodobacter olei TaxID=2493082 RepID=UPI0019D47C02|nr:arabinose transporter [Solirhodobacter olei]